jgi:hypothetical protein
MRRAPGRSGDVDRVAADVLRREIGRGEKIAVLVVKSGDLPGNRPQSRQVERAAGLEIGRREQLLLGE